MVIYRIYPPVSSIMAGRWRIPEPALVPWENHLMVFYRKKLEVPLGQHYLFGSWFWTYASSFCFGFHANVGPQPTRNPTHWGQGLSFEGTKGTKYHATISPKNELNTFVNGLVKGKITGKPHISWEIKSTVSFRFPLQPIHSFCTKQNEARQPTQPMHPSSFKFWI